MRYINNFHYNYFAIGELIPSLFMLFGALIILLNKEKSKASFYLGGAFLLHALYHLPYVVAHSFFHPWAAYHRWATVFFILASTACTTRFFFEYPVNTQPRLARAFLIGQILLTTLVSGYFMLATYDMPKFYHFDGHYWDFDADQMSARVGIVIFLFFIIFTGVGIYRAIIIKTEERWTLLALTIAFTNSLPSGILNIMSRNGSIGRDVYITSVSLITLVGLFAGLMIYINNSQDRMTFMAKIVGISLLTILVLLQFMSYLTLQQKDDSYDALHRKDAQLALQGPHRPPDLRYIAVYSAKDDDVKFTYKDDSAQVNLAAEKTAYQNVLVRARIAANGASNARPEEFPGELEKILDEAHPYFAGQGNALRAYAPAVSGSNKVRTTALLKKIDALYRPLLTRAMKIEKLPNEGFRGALGKYLHAQGGDFLPFRKAIESHLAKSQSEGALLKSETLLYLTLPQGVGARRYRYGTGSAPDHDNYIGFLRADPASGLVHEVGFSYVDYRRFMHPSALLIIYMLACVLAIVLVGFQFFFRGALIAPLGRLISGVARVNEGHLDIQLPVKCGDEIGYLSRSFNGMVLSIREARVKLQDYADNLEEKVKARTSELAATLEKVQELKTQQDGDYFLTSLLIRPLCANHAAEGNVAVEFLIKQKKRFKFRKWDEEIGGDINTAHRIKLRNRDHTVFLNADAMGKSIQGAGGVLVLGSVFESIIKRTRISHAVHHQHPERWLKNAFIELQEVFESFDGSMLISVFLGLVDDEAGLMYFINAEHPFTVLYRGGRAGFIEHELTFRKLGTPGLEGTIYVRTLQLEPGDVIIAGSDGRDDLEIGIDKDGQRIINEDTDNFLITVEEGGGNLRRIYRRILERGELTDDLSLLRVSYREKVQESNGVGDDAESHLQGALLMKSRGNKELAVAELEKALERDSRHHVALHELVLLYIELGNYEKAGARAEDYACLRPADTEFLYIASACFRKAGALVQAADMGERVRLREPRSVKNLLNLASIYLEDNPARAEKLARNVLKIDPSNKEAAAIIKAIAGTNGVAKA